MSNHSLEENNFVPSLINNFDPGLDSVTQRREEDGCGQMGLQLTLYFGMPNNLGQREHCVVNNCTTVLKWDDVFCSCIHFYLCISYILASAPEIAMSNSAADFPPSVQIDLSSEMTSWCTELILILQWVTLFFKKKYRIQFLSFHCANKNVI